MNYKVMQIETSNLCSLKCNYCPHPSQKRLRGNMTFDTFKTCIEVVRRSKNPEYKGKKFVWLNHFGEPLLNPLLPDFIEYATKNEVEVSFASNGVDAEKRLFPRATWEKLRHAGLKGVMLSAHVTSIRTLRAHIEDIIKVIAVFQPKKKKLHDWAGQVDISKYNSVVNPSMPTKPCDYATDDMFAIRWDGILAACCYDIEGRFDNLSISDVIQAGYSFQPMSLCSRCTLGRGDAVWLLDPLHQIL